MSRPTRYCAECGHYVADQYVTRTRYDGAIVATELRLVHIDADGRRLDFLAHKPVEVIGASK